MKSRTFWNRAFLSAVFGLLAAAVVLLLEGCQKRNEGASSAHSPAGSSESVARIGSSPLGGNNPIGQGGDPAAMAVRRGAEKLKNEAELHNLGLFYRQYIQGAGDSPSVEGFKEFFRKDSNDLYKALQDGRYVFILTANPTSDTVVAYEKDADYNGNRLVLMGDGSVKQMTNPELEKARIPKEG